MVIESRKLRPRCRSIQVMIVDPFLFRRENGRSSVALPMVNVEMRCCVSKLGIASAEPQSIHEEVQDALNPVRGLQSDSRQSHSVHNGPFMRGAECNIAVNLPLEVIISLASRWHEMQWLRRRLNGVWAPKGMLVRIPCTSTTSRYHNMTDEMPTDKSAALTSLLLYELGMMKTAK